MLTGVIPYIDLKKIKTTGKSGGKSQNKISLRVNLENSDTIINFFFVFLLKIGNLCFFKNLNYL